MLPLRLKTNYPTNKQTKPSETAYYPPKRSWIPDEDLPIPAPKPYLVPTTKSSKPLILLTYLKKKYPSKEVAQAATIRRVLLLPCTLNQTRHSASTVVISPAITSARFLSAAPSTSTKFTIWSDSEEIPSGTINDAAMLSLMPPRGTLKRKQYSSTRWRSASKVQSIKCLNQNLRAMSERMHFVVNAIARPARKSR